MKRILDVLINNIDHKVQSVQGRYITLKKIDPRLQKWNTEGQLKIINKSVLGKNIYSFKIGKGDIRILLWSQMHGNESTTTKALIDFINLLDTNINYSTSILNRFTFCVIPMLNPDGAELWIRENANNVDLNRDFKNLSQPESQSLMEVFHTFKPHYCFNLHDQRSIFGVGDTNKPATISFLAPAYNTEREINDNRQIAINLISGINEVLQEYICGQIGRFDDTFNINCAGDAFQFLGVPTILIEAGHYQNDYNREETRKFVLIALLASFNLINENKVFKNRTDEYMSIPQNKINFSDFKYKNVKIINENRTKIVNFVANYKEEIINGKLNFNAYISEIDSDIKSSFSHYEYNANGGLFIDANGNFPRLGQKANFYLGDDKFVNGTIV